MTPPEGTGPEPDWGERRRREEDLSDLYAGLGSEHGGSEEGSAPPPPPRSGPDFAPLFVLLDVIRRAAPSDLQDRVAALIREALLTLRSLIDWYLERLDQPRREPKVEDIPIE